MHGRYRLRSASQLRRARTEGRSWSHPILVLCAVSNGLDHSRFGFLTSKRVGGAVVRNRIRRLMREAVRTSIRVIEPGWDLVWIARSPSATSDYWGMLSAVETLLRRAGCRSADVIDGALKA